MNRYRSHTLLLVGFLSCVTLFLQVSCSPSSDTEAPVTAILKPLREGRTPENPDVEAFKTWFARTVSKRKTTRAEVTAILGPHARNLDRPDRDGVKTYEYFLGPPGNSGRWYYLVVDFDASTDVLLDWGISCWICGYCPHVYARDHTGSWRLEGKLLAGCVGHRNAGTDVLVLPRLAGRGRDIRVMLANSAPEIEILERPELASVSLQDGEELDVTADGKLAVWKPLKESPVGLRSDGSGHVTATIVIDRGLKPDVAVLELKNTARFEAAMRNRILAGRNDFPSACLAVRHGGQRTHVVRPVGTKFLRRVVVPLSGKATQIELSAQEGLWFIRRLWFGSLRRHPLPVRWRPARGVTHCRLEPMTHRILRFPPPEDHGRGQRLGHALRLHGYYEFLPRREGDGP